MKKSNIFLTIFFAFWSRNLFIDNDYSYWTSIEFDFDSLWNLAGFQLNIVLSFNRTDLTDLFDISLDFLLDCRQDRKDSQFVRSGGSNDEILLLSKRHWFDHLQYEVYMYGV